MNITPKTKSRIKLVLSLMLIAFIGVGLTSCIRIHKKKKRRRPKVEQTVKPKQQSSQKKSATYSELIVEGKDYKLELPKSAKGVKCVPVSEKRRAHLKSLGYRFITTPLHVTRNGEEHVQLDGVATVSIDIPKNFPKNQYMELVGVLLTDKGPVYKIPDYYALRKGVVRFETSHFCEVGVAKDKEKLRERFIEEVALNGWRRDMDNKALEPTWKEQLTKFAEDHCMGEDDLAGIAARELFADNDIVKVGLDIVNAHDMEDASLEERMEVASENMMKMAETKMMSYFLNKLKEEDTKKTKVLDELKSEKKGEFVYKTEIEKIDSRRNKIIEVLKDRFSIDSVQKAKRVLGENPSLDKCYVYACDQIKNQAVDMLKSKTKEMVPYIKAVEATAKGVEIWKKFWASTQMKDLYKKYEEKADERGGVVDQADWNEISLKLTTPKFLHGMSDAEIKAMLEERYCAKQEIIERKKEVRKTLDAIDSLVNLDNEWFEKKEYDYVKRLTIVNNLLDRFRGELLNQKGELIFMDNGYRMIYGNPNVITEQLCVVVDQYLEYYPNQEKFYGWLAKNGYKFGLSQKDCDKLDALLWKEEEAKIDPKINPKINIVIRETPDEEAEKAIYEGCTICLGKDKKPYLGWHANVPIDEDSFVAGWKIRYPGSGSTPVTLSQYKAMGMPNQVLVYENETAFENGKKPIKIQDFIVDTTGGTTMVELNEVVVDDYWIVFFPLLDDMYIQKLLPSLKKLDAKAHVKLMKSGDFNITYSGEHEQRSDDYGLSTEKSNFTISGNIDKRTGEGTFHLKGNIFQKSSHSGGSHRNISFEASGNVTSHADEYKKDGISCLYIKNNGTVVGLKSKKVRYYDKHSSGDIFYQSDHGFIQIDFKDRE